MPISGGRLFKFHIDSYYGGYYKGFYMFEKDRTMSDIIKCKSDWDCLVCRKKIPSGSFCLGKKYRKVCLNCANKFLEKVKKDLNGYSQQIQNTKTELKQNEDKFKSINTLAQLEHTEKKN